MVGKQRSTAWIDFAITTKVLLVASPVATETSKLQYTVFVRMIEAKFGSPRVKTRFREKQWFTIWVDKNNQSVKIKCT